MSRNVYIGRSGSGKTTLVIKQLAHMCKNSKFVNKIIVVTGSFEQQVDKWRPVRKWITKQYPKIDADTSYKLYMAVYDNWYKNKRRRKQHRVFIVLDDCGESTFLKLAKKENAINELVTKMLHYGESHIFILFQSFKQSMATMRENADQIFVFKIKNIEEKEAVRKTFAGELSPEEWQKITHKAWDFHPYSYLHIDRSHVEDTVYYADTERITGY